MSVGDEMSEGLKLCPFCGNTEMSRSAGHRQDGGAFRFVECMHCGAHGPIAGIETLGETLWNRRATAPTPPAADASAAALLRAEADRYQREDGTPGDLASAWGWRDTARILREVAAKVDAGGADAGREVEQLRADLDEANNKITRLDNAYRISRSECRYWRREAKQHASHVKAALRLDDQRLVEAASLTAERDALKAEVERLDAMLQGAYERGAGAAMRQAAWSDVYHYLSERGNFKDARWLGLSGHQIVMQFLRETFASNARLRAACEAAERSISHYNNSDQLTFDGHRVLDELRAALAEGRGE